ncbi:MAG: gluconate 2-dehydrogenase subunit 3 family protein [Chitinophagaceae bacterium]
MDRRQSLKALAVSTLSAGVVLEACKDSDKKAGGAPKTEQPVFTLDRQPEEIELYNNITSKTFFSPHEMATITILADIIIPRDEVSGSASDAKVPDFIEFIVKDMPEHQIPMRGGLRWLDVQCLKRFERSFADCSDKQRIEVVDDIAYPAKAKKEFAQGVAFFNLMRNLTATGFYTSEIGVKDVGYEGNKPNAWNGVPDDVLKQYGYAYTEKEMNECAKY